MLNQSFRNMMQNKMAMAKRLGLWASIGLCSILLIEAGPKVVKAIEAIDLGQTKTIAADPPRLQLDSSTSPRAANRPTALPTEPQKLAINSAASDAEQPVARVSPAQIATATWNGASFPVENFQAYTSPFGYRSSPYGGYTQEFHYGLDMAAPEGSYIRGWWTGKVVEVSDDSNCGTSVVIESGPWMHIYCHMQGHVETEKGKRYLIDRDGGIQIWEGQQLPAGARVGRVGMTGRTTGPHLHWGLKYDSNWVDPALVLRAMYYNQQTAANSNRE